MRDLRATASDKLRAGMIEATQGLQDELRGQVSAAGLGSRLANSWRSQVYPGQGAITLSPAGMVWSKAPTLMRAYEEGTIIRAKNAQALAIPTDLVPMKGGRRPMTPVEVEARFGRDLRYVPLKNGNAVLIMDQVMVSKSGKLRKASQRRSQAGQKVRGTVMFVLVRQVMVKKRIDIAKASASAQVRLSAGLAGLAEGIGNG